MSKKIYSMAFIGFCLAIVITKIPAEIPAGNERSSISKAFVLTAPKVA